MSDEGLVCTERPDIFIDECIAIGRQYALKPPFLLGIRGFEQPGQNSVGVYDDCICIVDLQHYEACNANTDPSKLGFGMATVSAPQQIYYRLGIHNLSHPEKQYPALVQAGPILVTRQGIGAVPPGWFGINIHRGGVTSPGSEGCQTIPPNQWPEFYSKVEQVFKIHKLTSICYLLIER